MSKWRFVASAALAVALLPVVAVAQRVSGQVKVPFGTNGGGGILVIARDTAGTEVARAVTSDEGRFAVPLPRPAFYRVALERVGFAPTVILERQVAAGEVVSLEPDVGGTVTTLPSRDAAPPSSCGSSATGRLYVATLMQEFHKALAAAQLVAARQGITARWAITDHRLTANARDTSRYSIARRAGNPMAAFGSPVLAEIQRSGFVVKAGTDRIFRGLDLAALSSPWFMESYCFTAREGNAGAFVVSFEPKQRRRDYVDVAGDIYLNRATLEPQFLEFLYVGLTADEDKRGAGGKMSFARAQGGSWLVSDWMIRFPQVGLIELETFRDRNNARVMQPEVLGHEILAWRTTALLEGQRRIWANDAMATANIEGPIRGLCQERVLNARIGAAKGRILYDGRPVNAATVRAAWRRQVDVGGEVPLWRDETREAVSSRTGDWVLCDLPTDGAIEISWEVLGRKTTASVRLSRDEVVTLDENGRPVTPP